MVLCNRIDNSPSAVALEIGLSKTAVSGWKNGRSNPTDAMLRKIADYFGVTVDDFISEHKEKPTAKGDELDEASSRLLELYRSADEQERQEMMNYVECLLSKRKKPE